MALEDDNTGEEFRGDENDDSEVLPCPSCGQPVHEDTPKCPHCGDWITPLRASAAKPIWVRVVGVIVVIGLLLGATRALLRLLR